MILKLTAGPRLLALPDDGLAAAWEDVTATAHEHLMDPVISVDLKLSDLATLVQANPILRTVLAQCDIDVILAEMSKGAQPFVPRGYTLDYLELAFTATLDSYSNEYRSYGRPSCRAMGRPTYAGITESDVHSWTFAFIPVRKLMHAPLRFNPLQITYEGDNASTSCGEELRVEKLPSIPLLQVLHGVFGELSLYGPPTDETLTAMMLPPDADELNAELSEILTEEISESVAESSSPMARLLVSTLEPAEFKFYFTAAHGRTTPQELVSAIRSMPDDFDVVEQLCMQFGESSFTIREGFAGLTAHEVRRAYYTHVVGLLRK